MEQFLELEMVSKTKDFFVGSRIFTLTVVLSPSRETPSSVSICAEQTEGDAVNSLIKAFCTAVTIALQAGVPIREIAREYIVPSKAVSQAVLSEMLGNNDDMTKTRSYIDVLLHRVFCYLLWTFTE